MPADARKDWLTELTTVELQSAGNDGWMIGLGRLCAVNTVAYIRDSQARWLAWSETEQQPLPDFNWIAVYNFHSDPKAAALALDAAGAEALMLVRDGHVVRCDSGPKSPLVYVSFLEVAPWNRPAAGGRTRWRGVGTAMLRAASDLSLQRGYGGRVGLHSVRAAEGFYRRLGFDAVDCRNEYSEIYFELSESGAQALLSD